MTSLKTFGGTFVGRVASVRGNLVQVRLEAGATTLLMVAGSSHRLGQLGSFARIPLGYVDLFGTVVQVGAEGMRADVQPAVDALATEREDATPSYRWMTIALFGESAGKTFERGVSQYPTVGDQVHLTTAQDLEVIYGTGGSRPDSISVGGVAGSGNLPAFLNLTSLLTRHSCVVGSTGSGKSNLVAVVLAAIARPAMPSSRAVVIDPHGEYSSALGALATVVRTDVGAPPGEALRVPYWALKFDDLLAMCIGPIPDRDVEHIRDRVRQLKAAAAQYLPHPPPAGAITADSPLPFSIRRLWFELEDVERATFSKRECIPENQEEPLDPGDPEELLPPVYPEASAYNTAPYLNSSRRNIRRQLDFMRSRLQDTRYQFMFGVNDGWHPDLDGRIESDVDELLAAWVGSENQLTILDVSGLPDETVGVVVGTMLNLVYEALFWAFDLPVSGRNQPLLVVVDEAHRFLPANGHSPAASACLRIAREGRKHGIGLMTVTQRPSDVDHTILSQSGTMIALRLTNASDRAAVASTVPDDLGGLVDLLPSLRTGEGIVLGEAIAIPSRVRFDRAPDRPHGDDPNVADAWARGRPSPHEYSDAVRQWRDQQVMSRSTDA